MAYSDYEQDLAMAFVEEIKKGRVNPQNLDIQSNKSKNLYHTYLANIAGINPKEYFVSDFDTVNFDDFKNICFDLAIIIFGEDFIKDFIEYFNTLVTNGSKSFLDGIALSFREEGKHEIAFRQTEIPNVNCIGCIVTVMHEFVHFLASKYKMDFNKKRYYEEILSILVEKLVSDYLSRYTSDSFVQKKVEHTRLETIKFHYINSERFRGVFNYYDALKQQHADLSFVETAYPFIKDRRTMYYWQNLADSYGIGYLYSESLFYEFLNNPKVILEKLRSTLKGNIPLKKFLSEYSINATNENVYEKANKKIKSLK